MDVMDYLRRCSASGPVAPGGLEPTLGTLKVLHEAHLIAIPFENLDIHCGQSLCLDEVALFKKIVLMRRGGICYELNGLFATLLRRLGFRVSLISAGVAHDHVHFGPEFDHLALLVHLADGDWLADVGFSSSFRHPLKFEAEVVQAFHDHSYRLHRESAYWIVQRARNSAWESLYRFQLQPHEIHHFAERCRYQETSPESYFTQNLLFTRATETGRITLCDRKLAISSSAERSLCEIQTEEEYRAMLIRHFGITLLPETRLRFYTSA